MTDSLPAVSPFLTLPSSHPSLSSAGPFLLNPLTSEPYLPIPGTSLILTPSRSSDIPHRVALLTSPSVDPFVFSPPRPYTTDHATERFHTQRSDEQDIFDAWESKGVTGLPVGTIRERREGETKDRFVGELGFLKETGFHEIRDEEERKKAIESNKSKPPGDPSIL
ncbi:hypothetical protein BCR35DRAFT_307571 [Leucosporidium creatinivorum]|uniref:Uncharacterized protein n=1 Tax=Leucosporidium creatinivorum TaxID=106004 RepID=A0A1Y2EM01_9BASI|nr:hypothetical protein BCR35DRAFT_307571 [Leucosporidium creatinivorum]